MLVLNKGTHNTTLVLPRGKALTAVQRVFLPAGILTQVDDKVWAECKKIKMCKQYLDNGILETGKKAAKTSEKSGVSAALSDVEKEAAAKAAGEAVDKEAEKTETTEEDVLD